MKPIQVFFLSLFCLFNSAGMWKDNPKIQKEMDQGYQAWQKGNRTEALRHYEAALMFKPDQVDALNSSGVIYEELGWPAKAEEKYLIALSVNDRFLPAYFNLGILYWNQGRIQKAVYYFEKRVEYGNPNDPWTIKSQKALAHIKAKARI